MARQIVVQPNGLYSCWSTIIDDFIAVDMTEAEYIEFRSKETYEEKKEELRGVFSDYKAGLVTPRTCAAFMRHEECLKIKGMNK